MDMIRKDSIRSKFIVGLATVITVVVLSFSLILIAYNTKSVDRQIRKQLQKITAFSQESLSIALWQYNHDYISRYIDSLFLYEDVVYASIAVNGKAISEKSLFPLKPKLFQDLAEKGNYITSEAPISYNDVHIGTMQLVLSRDRITELVITTSKLSIAILLLVNFAVFCSLYLLSTKYIFHPLAKLENSVKAISSGRLDEAIDVGSPDEIGQLAGSFRQMMENLQKMTASRDELNHEIQERKQSESRIELLNSLKESLLGPKDIQEKLKLITQSVIEIVGGDFCRIWLLREGDLCGVPCHHRDTCYGDSPIQEKKDCLHLLSSSGRYQHTDGKRQRHPIGIYKIGKLVSGDQKSFFSNNIENDSRIENPEWAKHLGLNSFAGYKLFSSTAETVGVMALFSKNSIRDKENEILLNIASTASEVVQSAHSQEQIIESEKKFRNLFENAQVGMYRSRITDGKIVESNQRMAEIFDYQSPEDCINNYVATERYVSPEIRQEIVDSLLDEGIITNQIIQIRTHKKNEKWIQFSGSLSEVKGCFEGVAIDITDKKIAEEKVQASLEEKEILIKEIHHRVKNNMQIIQSLLSLQSDKVKDSEYQKLLLDSNSRIKSMALIHEILYQADDISHLNLKHYFNSIVSNLSRVYQNPNSSIIIDLNIEQIPLDMDLSIACGLIINELVTNSYKYGFAGKKTGKLSISLNKNTNDEIVLLVADDGPGISEEFEIMESESLGLKIVRILVSGQLKGQIEIQPPPGTVVQIRFPYNA